jgi:hypothetical protein
MAPIISFELRIPKTSSSPHFSLSCYVVVQALQELTVIPSLLRVPVASVVSHGMVAERRYDIYSGS